MHHRLLLQELGSTLTLFLTTHHSPLNLHPYSQVARQPSAGQEAVEAVLFDLCAPPRKARTPGLVLTRATQRSKSTRE